MAVEIVFNGAALRSIALQASDADIRVRANRVLNAARRGAPVDTGALRGSLTVTFNKGPGGETVARIGSNLPYAMWVHEGTGIYGPRGAMITPKRGRFLVWPRVNNSGSGNRRYVGGQTGAFIFAKAVRGSPGRPFLLRALEAAR